MNRLQKLTAGLIVLAALIPALAQTTSAQAKAKKQKVSQEQSSSVQIARGETLFEENCARCHNAPRAFPPQISATIVRHMRVRASLSASDEKALLRFMNP